MSLRKTVLFTCILSALFVVSFSPVFAATVKPLALSEADRAWLNEHLDEIYFAPERSYPPMIWSEYGVVFGISYDYVKLLEQQLDVQIRDREPRTLFDILNATQSGEQNIISSITPTPEREKFLIFTRPYLEVPAVYITKSGKQNIGARDVVDRKLKVGVGKGYAVEEYLRNRYTDMVLVPFENDYLVLSNVSSGVVDVGALDTLSLSYLVKEEGFQNIKVMGDTGYSYNLSFAVPASMIQLRNMLDDAIEALPEKVVYELRRKWLPDETSAVYLGTNPSASDATSLTFLYTLIAILLAVLIVVAGFVARHFMVRHTTAYRELEQRASERPR